YSNANEEELQSSGEIGGDMMWNPDGELLYDQSPGDITIYKTFGQHFLYVTDMPYDSCKMIRQHFVPGGSFVQKFPSMVRITWTGIPFTNGTLLSYQEGLIPDEATIQLRVTNPFALADSEGMN